MEKLESGNNRVLDKLLILILCTLVKKAVFIKENYSVIKIFLYGEIL